jgi:hypothetical protein
MAIQLENPKNGSSGGPPSLKNKKRRSRKLNQKKGGGPRPFPAESLQAAIQVPKVIKEFNGGNPWPPGEVAKALEIAPRGNKCWYLTASAQHYGLTSGTRDTELIELAATGRSFVYASSPAVERESVEAAFFNVDVFKKVYDYYGGNNLPELRFLQNTLESEFKIPREYHTDFHRLFRENCTFLDSFPDSEGSHQRTTAPAAIKEGSVTLGEPTSKTSLVAFVVMPFSEKTDRYPEGFYAEVLTNLITPAGVEAGFKVETARKHGSDIIQSTIVNDLLDADLVIVDLSDHNPNVLFELGVRMAHDKPIALIRAEGTAPIFDVDNMLRVLDYNPNLWKSTLESDLPRLIAHIGAVWESRGSTNTYMKILRGKGVPAA